MSPIIEGVARVRVTETNLDGFTEVQQQQRQGNNLFFTKTTSLVQPVFNSFEQLRTLGHEERWAPKDADYFVQRDIQAKKIRKQDEWEHR